ncbi:Mobile element protein [Methanosarcina siciliae C2J]|uniref:Mobile element protein n=1 Tax=Methanosarcina siciliae C2J TaxID=1434118 RepID=A0A0E3LDU9_9EURY|nr:Mobile element protein [Methanosarcina siciliae C2J]
MVEGREGGRGWGKESREAVAIERRMKSAVFSVKKTLEEFDFD